MLDKPMTLVCALLVAGDVRRFHAAGAWRLNEALTELDAQAQNADLLGWWCRSSEQVVGCASAILSERADGSVVTAQGAIHEMLRSGALSSSGRGTARRFELTDLGRLEGRRLLFRLPVEEAELLYLAGRRVARRLSTSSKNWASSAWVPTTRSGTPRRRLQSAPGL